MRGGRESVDGLEDLRVLVKAKDPLERIDQGNEGMFETEAVLDGLQNITKKGFAK